MERRLTTIVAADMVGYSRLISGDEEGTLLRLAEARKDLIDPEIEGAGGRIVKTMGDGLLVEFPSPVAAVRAVIAVQAAMARREAGRPEDARIVFRVGVNLGDVVIDGDDIMGDIMGDGVNIAARLETLAVPGGIVVSRSVYEQVKGKIDTGFTDLGSQQVKNIPDPVKAYAVALDGITAAPRPRQRGRARVVLVALVVALAVAIGGYVTMTRQTDALAGLPPVDQSLKSASLMVLPFQDFSEDKSLDHFADGLTEDLITDLARWKEFRVTARNSAMTYKDKVVDVRDVAREMNTRYVLEGSVRRIGDQMRITAQLIDGETGNHVWAERFEETGSNVLALQDKVIGKIVQTLIGNYGVIREDEYARTWAKAESDLDEYDYYLRGHALFYHFNPTDMARAIEIWKEGLTKYPNSGLLKIKQGWGYQISRQFQFTDTPESMGTVLELAQQGLADPALPPAGHRFGLWLLARINADMGNRAGAFDAAKQVAESYPFDAEGLFYMGSSMTLVGDYDFADQLVARALDLGYTPDALDRAGIGSLRYAQEDCARAVPLFESGIFDVNATLLLAGCYAQADRIDDAKAKLATAAEEFGATSPADFPENFRYMPGVTERLTAQLSKAGWPTQ